MNEGYIRKPSLQGSGFGVRPAIDPSPDAPNTQMSPEAQSKMQRQRNASTFRVTKVANGFICQNGDTGETFVAKDISEVVNLMNKFFEDEEE